MARKSAPGNYWQRRKFLKSTLAGSLGVGLAGCGGTADDGDGGDGGDGTGGGGDGGDSGDSEKTTLRITTPAEQTTLDAAFRSISQETEWMDAHYNSLFRVEAPYRSDSDEWTYVPDLAESWEYLDEEDGVIAQINLRDDVTYHNGDQLDAELVKTEIDFWFEETAPASSGLTFVNRVSVDNDTTLNLHMDNRVATLLFELAEFGIPNPYVREERGAGVFAGDITGGGTGPYQFVEYVEGSEIRFERYDDYHVDSYPNMDTVPAFEELVVKIIPEASTRLSQLRAGEIDLDNWITPENHQALNDDQIVTQNEPAAFYATALFNLEADDAEPIRDNRVRRALIQAIDREGFGEAQFSGFHSPVSQPAPPGLWFYYEDLHEMNLFDLESAQQLLDDAGYGDGFEIHAYSGSAPFFRRMGELVQSMWSEIGVELNLEPIEYGSMWSNIRDQNFTIAISRTVGPPDPDWFFRRYIIGADEPGGLGVVNGWSHEEYSELAAEQFNTEPGEQERRNELVRRMAEIWAEEMPSLWFSATDNLSAHDRRLKGYWHWPQDTSREAIRDLYWEED